MRTRGRVPSEEKDGIHEDGEESDARSRSPARNASRSDSRRGESVSSRDTELIAVTDEEMEVSDASRASSTSSKKRKRGRPQTTGDPSKGIPCDYHQKLARLEKEAKEEEEQREKDRCDPTVRPTEIMARKKLAKDLGTEEELMREFRMAPTSDIQAQVLEVIDRVDKGATCSNNIKGTVVKDMRRAAVITRAAMTVLSLRTDTSAEVSLSEQLEEMRTEMATMRRENERLRLQLNSLKKKTKGARNRDGNS